MTAKNRILRYIEFKGIGQREFARTCNFSHTLLQNTKSSIGADNLEKIINNYPELNIYWVITGKGEMVLTDNNLINTTISDIQNSSMINEDKQLLINLLKKENKILKEEISKLKAFQKPIPKQHKL